MSYFLVSHLILIIILCSIIGAGSGSVAEIALPDQGPSEDLSLAAPEIQDAYHSRPLANEDYSTTRNQQETDISSETVKNLTPSWTYPITGHATFGSATTNPVMTNDIVYFQDLAGNIVALTLKDGTPRWRANYNSTTILGPNGPAIGYGKVFISPDGHSVSALDKENGLEIWSTRISPSNSTGINIQPVVNNKKIFLATVPGTSASDFYTGG